MADQMARRQERVPARRSQAASPFRGMSELMESMMEDFFSDWPMMRIRPSEWRMQEFSPSIDVIDEENQIRIEAEVPGMAPEDLEITAVRDSLVLRGEKRSEKEEEQRGVRYSERSYGSFHRVVRLGPDVETDKIEAKFKNGVLEIIVPKAEQSLRQARKIQISSETEGQQQATQPKSESQTQSMGAEEGIKQKSQS